MSLAEFIYTRLLRPRPIRAFANALLLRLIPDSIRIGAVTLYLDPADPVISGALALRVFEPSELAFFRNHCRDGMTVVDIGANIGLYTVLAMHQLGPEGRVISFEPYPRSFEFLKANIAVNGSASTGEERVRPAPRVDALNVAAGADTGRQYLHLNPENHGDNRLYQGSCEGEVGNWEAVEVEERTADSVMAELGIGNVNFVKIDVQGYEQQAISGFRKTLGRSPQVILMSEFWPQGLKEAGGSAVEYLRLLTDLGFTLYELKQRPRGQVVRLRSWDSLIHRLQGRKYANLVGIKGYDMSSC